MMPEIHPIDLENDEKLNQEKKERSKQRKGKVAALLKGAFKTVVITLITLLLLAAGVLGSAFVIKGYESGGLIKKTVVDYRECAIEIPGTTQVIKGTRSYQYQYKQFAGWRYYNAAAVNEETRLNIEGTEMTIIGNSPHTAADKVWSKNIDRGERYSQLLQKEDRYTIIYGEDRIVISVDYSAMCK